MKTDELKDKLIICLNDYATFLGKIIDANTVYLYIHGIKASEEEIQKGKEFRDKLESLISQIKQNES